MSTTSQYTRQPATRSWRVFEERGGPCPAPIGGSWSVALLVLAALLAYAWFV